MLKRSQSHLNILDWSTYCFSWRFCRNLVYPPQRVLLTNTWLPATTDRSLKPLISDETVKISVISLICHHPLKVSCLLKAFRGHQTETKQRLVTPHLPHQQPGLAAHLEKSQLMEIEEWQKLFDVWPLYLSFSTWLILEPLLDDRSNHYWVRAASSPRWLGR